MAYYTNGGSTYLSRNDTLGITDYPITVSQMLRPDSQANRVPFCFGDTDALAYILFYMRDPADNDLLAWSRDDATSDWADTTTSYTTSGWHHVCGVWASSTSRIPYIDGGGSQEAVVDVPWPAGLDNTTLGARWQSGSVAAYYQGGIAETAVWNVALTTAEISLLSAGASPLLVRPGNLVAYWPLVDNLNDIVGGYNLTNHSATIEEHPRVFRPYGPCSSFAAYVPPVPTEFWRKIVTEYTSPTLVDLTTTGKRIKNKVRVTFGDTPYTITEGHEILANTDGGGVTTNLPVGVDGRALRIVNTGTSGNMVTICPNGVEHLIGVNTNFFLRDGDALLAVYDVIDGWY